MSLGTETRLSVFRLKVTEFSDVLYDIAPICIRISIYTTSIKLWSIFNSNLLAHIMLTKQKSLCSLDVIMIDIMNKAYEAKSTETSRVRFTVKPHGHGFQLVNFVWYLTDLSCHFTCHTWITQHRIEVTCAQVSRGDNLIRLRFNCMCICLHFTINIDTFILLGYFESYCKS